MDARRGGLAQLRRPGIVQQRRAIGRHQPGRQEVALTLGAADPASQAIEIELRLVHRIIIAPMAKRPQSLEGTARGWTAEPARVWFCLKKPHSAR